MTSSMMELEARVEEVKRYLRVLERLDNPRVVLFDLNTRRPKRVLERKSLQVMKATVFLMIYNLIESSIRSAFRELYDAIREENIEVQKLCKRLRKVWFKQRLKTLDTESSSALKIIEHAEKLIEEIVSGVTASLDSRKLPLSGNVDSDQIRDVCKKHGIFPKVHHRAFGGAELTTIKKKRNDLSHGHISFAECGQDYTVSDLKRISRQAEIYIKGVLKSIDKLTRSRDFRENTSMPDENCSE